MAFHRFLSLERLSPQHRTPLFFCNTRAYSPLAYKPTRRLDVCNCSRAITWKLHSYLFFISLCFSTDILRCLSCYVRKWLCSIRNNTIITNGYLNFFPILALIKLSATVNISAFRTVAFNTVPIY